MSELIEENVSTDFLDLSQSPMYFFYGFFCKNTDINTCYIGKTTNLASRISCHKSESKYSQRKLYVFIREHGGFDNWNIKVLHKCICDELLSNYIEYALIQKYKDNGNEMLNTQFLSIPCFNNTYNKNKCTDHYKIKTDCVCGWSGSKMNYSKHVKTSKKHRDFCIEKFEKQVECVMMVQDGNKSHTFTYVTK